jgi:hypothetical protein
MIKICTIHHESNKFIKLQNDYFKNNTNDEYEIYCGISNINGESEVHNTNYINLTNITTHHALRLNYLYELVKHTSSDDDILVFVDSDCFPIQNWDKYIKEKLIEFPIVAIQRKENYSAPMGCVPELHPHPCFFATTVGFWKNNKLSFNINETAGYDVGTFLKNNNMDFYKLLRSNTVNIHPLMFGVYDDIIYHHGAGNRPPYDGVDICLRQRLGHGVEMDLFYPQILNFNQKLSNLVYDEILKDKKFINNFLLGIK